MSNASDFAALKASIMDLYKRGLLPHTVDPHSLKTVTQSTSGATGVGNRQYYTSGLIQGIPYFIDPAGSFKTNTVVKAGDILRVQLDEFTIDNPITNSLSDVKVSLANPSPVSIPAIKDVGYSIIRYGVDSPLDDIFAQIDAIKTDLGL